MRSWQHLWESRWRKPSREAIAHLPTASLFCAGALLLGVALAVAQSPSPDMGGESISVDAPAEEGLRREGVWRGVTGLHAAQKDRLREGTELIDEQGSFRMTGDRVTFFTADGEGRFLVLENLALERIVRVVEDNPETLSWLVTGTITEYHGANYFLVHRAVLRRRS